MKRTALSLALLFATATLAALVPPASASLDPVVWEGVADYSFSREGQIDKVDIASPGCQVSPTFYSGAIDNPPATSSSARGSAVCVPQVDPALVKGKIPTCTATLIGTVSGGPGVIVGYAYCDPVYTYCVGTTAVPCTATASATPSSRGGCGVYLATGVNAVVRVRCTVRIVWA